MSDESNFSTHQKVLVFGRRRHFERVKKLVSLLYKGAAEIQLISDERLGGSETIWWGRYFYKNYKESKGLDKVAGFPVDDMIQRCRYLRGHSTEQATKMVAAAILSWEEILSDDRFDAVVTLPVDSFVLDSLIRVAEQKKIPAISPIATLFPGRVRFTVRGELSGSIDADENSNEELERTIEKLSDRKFKPDFLMGTDSTIWKTAWRRVLIDSLKVPAFWLYRNLAGDPLSYSFPPKKFLNKRMFATPSRANKVLDFEKKSTLNFPDKFVLMPLQFYPESTSDYWIPELEMCNHHRAILAVARALSKEYAIVVKEHPAGIARRDSDVLRKLAQIPNVYVAPTRYPMTPLVERSSLVVGYASSTLLQAVCLNVPVLYCGTPYYGADDDPVIKELGDPASILQSASAAINSSRDATEGRRKLERIFRSTAKGSLGSFAPLGERLVVDRLQPEVTEEMASLFFDALNG